ncbi:MAG: substrate-binding domain-containing protein, partial [Elusimicrobiota bacterium]
VVTKQKKLNGVIALAPHVNTDLLKTMEETKIPSVLINCRSDKLSWVDVDNVHGAMTMTEHLIKLGHERILCIMGFPESQNSLDRLEGYKRALEKYRIKFNPQLVIPCDFSITLAYERMQELLARSAKLDFTAIFASNDLMAVGAIRALVDKNIRVPEDVAVVGFDDFDFSSSFFIPLTTYRQPFVNIGFAATRVLLKQLETGFDPTKQFEMIGEIIVRDSCGAKRRIR